MPEAVGQVLQGWGRPVPAPPPARAHPQPGVHSRRLGLGGDEQAVLLRLLAPRIAPREEAAWRLLAVLRQGAFYQALRVEQGLGYALFSRFQTGEAGIELQFGVRSPAPPAEQLQEAIRRFVADGAAALATLPEARLQQARQAVLDSLAEADGQRARRLRACQAWLNAEPAGWTAAVRAALAVQLAPSCAGRPRRWVAPIRAGTGYSAAEVLPGRGGSFSLSAPERPIAVHLPPRLPPCRSPHALPKRARVARRFVLSHPPIRPSARRPSAPGAAVCPDRRRGRQMRPLVVGPVVFRKYERSAPCAEYWRCGPLPDNRSTVGSGSRPGRKRRQCEQEQSLLLPSGGCHRPRNQPARLLPEIVLYDKNDTTFSTDGYFNAFYVNSDVDRAGEQFDRKQSRVKILGFLPNYIGFNFGKQVDDIKLGDRPRSG